jgi:hypothetical protein
MNATKLNCGGNLFITYKDLSSAETGVNKRLFIKNGIEKIVSTEYSKAKRVDSFKRIKSSERAINIILSHNPDNIESAQLKKFDGTIINYTVISEKKGLISKHKLDWK